MCRNYSLTGYNYTWWPKWTNCDNKQTSTVDSKLLFHGGRGIFPVDVFSSILDAGFILSSLLLLLEEAQLFIRDKTLTLLGVFTVYRYINKYTSEMRIFKNNVYVSCIKLFIFISNCSVTEITLNSCLLCWSNQVSLSKVRWIPIMQPKNECLVISFEINGHSEIRIC